MPKQQFRRQDRQDLNSTPTTTEGGGVYASQNVRVKQSNINFDALGNFATQVVEQRRAKLDAALYQEGINAANTGEIDEEKMEYEAFTRGLNQQQGTIDALKTASGIQRDLEETLRAHKDAGTLQDFNINEYMEQAVQEYQREDGDENYLKGFNSKMTAVQATARGLYEKVIAEAEDEQVQYLAQDTINSRLELVGDGPVPDGLFDEIAQELADINGLNRDEEHDAVYQGVLHAASMGRVGAAEAAAEWLNGKGKDVKGKYGAKMEQAIAMAKQRAARASAEEESRTSLEKAQVRRSLEGTLGTDDFNLNIIDQATEQGYITSDQNVSLWKRHQDLLERQTLEAQTSAQLNYFLDNPDALPYLLTDPTLRKAAFEQMDAQYQQAGAEFLGAARAMGQGASTPATENALADSITNMKPLVRASQAAGHTPKFINQVMSSAQLGTPQFEAVATMVGMLETEFGSTPFQDVDTEKLADLQTFNFYRSMGYPSDEAAQMIQEEREADPAAVNAILFSREGREALDSTIQEYLGSNIESIKKAWYQNDTETAIEASPTLVNGVRELSEVFVRRGMSPEDATELAVDRFVKTHAPIGRAWVPNKRMPESFPAAFEQYVEASMPDKDFDDLIVVPTGDARGTFNLVQASNMMPLRDSEGNIWTNTYVGVVSGLQDAQIKRTADDFEANKQQKLDNLDEFQAMSKRLEELKAKTTKEPIYDPTERLGFSTF